MGRAIGIDLGTTYCVTAAVRAGRPEVLWNREGDHLTPAVVLFHGPGQVLVGKTAKHATKDVPGDCAEFVKRQMGNPDWAFADSHGEAHGAEKVSGLILRRLADDAAGALGEEVSDVVITVPAYFDDARRKATRDAGEIAGLNVLRLINEPTAAGIAFGATGTGSGTLMVYDLGGGTYDVTVMRAEGEDLRVIATAGDRDLGGSDFDDVLMAHVAAEVTAQSGPDLLDGGRRQAELREKCEQAKHALSRAHQTRLFFSDARNSYTVEVTRLRFERMVEDLVLRTARIAEEVLDDAGVSWAQLDRVLLVGGATRMPMVRRMIERLSGRFPDTSVDPDEAVALGAAILADLETGAATRLRVQDVTSQSLGIISVEPNGITEVNSIIVRKNTPIPCHNQRIFRTVVGRQRDLVLRVTEGDAKDARHTNILAEHPIRLPEGLPRHSPLKVVMSYDFDGVVHVELIDMRDGGSLGEVDLDRRGNLDSAGVMSLSDTVRDVTVQ